MEVPYFFDRYAKCSRLDTYHDTALALDSKSNFF